MFILKLCIHVSTLYINIGKQNMVNKTKQLLFQTIKQKILQEMNKPDHVQYSSFLVICVTTGLNPQYIYGKDGEKDCLSIQDIQELMSQCGAFSNKPKILMVHTVPESSCKLYMY